MMRPYMLTMIAIHVYHLLQRPYSQLRPRFIRLRLGWEVRPESVQKVCFTMIEHVSAFGGLLKVFS